jgi:probable addiction module antidote protein
LHFGSSSTGARRRMVPPNHYKRRRGSGEKIIACKKMIKVSKFDAADYLDNQETIAAYLSQALEPGDIEFVYEALHTIARAKGMTDFAKEAFSGNSKPEFDTVRKVIESFGLKLVAEPVDKNKKS